MLGTHHSDAGPLRPPPPPPLAPPGGREDIIESLLNSGSCEANARDSEGNTPAMYAAAKGHLPAMRLLGSRAKINPEERNNQGWTTLHFAAANCHTEMLSYLLAQPGAKPDSRSGTGATPLHTACGSNNLAGVEVLLAAGADRNLANAAGHLPAECSANPTIHQFLGFVVRRRVPALAMIAPCPCLRIHGAA